MTLRNRISVAAAVGVLIVVAAVSSVLYFSYAASLRSRVDATLVDAAQQASGIARRVKQSGGNSQSTPDISTPVTVGSVEVQLFPRPGGGRSAHAVRTARQTRCRGSRGRAARVLCQRARRRSAVPGLHRRLFPATPGGGLVRTSRAANADDGALRNAALLLAGLTVAAAGITYGAARLTAGRILRPIAELTAAAEHVAQDPRPHRPPPLHRDQR